MGAAYAICLSLLPDVFSWGPACRLGMLPPVGVFHIRIPIKLPSGVPPEDFTRTFYGHAGPLPCQMNQMNNTHAFSPTLQYVMCWKVEGGDPCTYLKPIYIHLSKKYTNVEFLKIDLDNIKGMKVSSTRRPATQSPLLIMVRGALRREAKPAINLQYGMRTAYSLWGRTSPNFNSTLRASIITH